MVGETPRIHPHGGPQSQDVSSEIFLTVKNRKTLHYYREFFDAAA
jgi:hypothetical protein